MAASDLIPEVNREEEENPMVSIVVFAGVAVFYFLYRLIPREYNFASLPGLLHRH